ncbi:MAG: hypothetical protein B7C24_03040 [Bacteroidetes bacterium 4572_77]|nr:MAG: hypothetical protein B7C24_03040 [Bacteroidetes bacterium 4572_77]
MRQLFTTIILLFFGTTIMAQISHGGEPYSSNSTSLKYNIDYRIMPEVNTEQLLMEDAIDENDPDIPWRFGKDIPVDISMDNAGTWDLLPNGDRIWRLEIISYGAFSLNLIFEKYHLPMGGSLFLYNPSKDHIIGSFTSENHKPNGGFATIPVKGERIILEYYEPKKQKGKASLEISYVIHAYKDFYTNFDKGFGSSGSCNVNVNCPEGSEWEQEKRGVAMILTSNNTRKCSGSMINNTAQDGTPYFLTANHCKGGGPEDWIIMFNYESPSCDNIDGPTHQSIQHTTLKASNFGSDFMLIELSEIPPPEYEVYYNGWNRLNSPSDQSVCIHHPKGDIKKISFDYDLTLSDRYLGNSGIEDSHWKIGQWELGTTEGGSSGSPLFNQSKQIVGQLHGGYASCTNLSSDWYGKFSMSWDYGSSPSGRLIDWLDPLGLGYESLGGYDPSVQSYELNAQMVGALEPQNQYGEPVDVNPTFVLRNMGSQNIQSLNVSYKINNNEWVNTNWTGDMATYDTVHIVFPSVHLDYGQHQIWAYCDSPNGSNDEFLNNDSTTKNISVNYGYDLAIENFISPDDINCDDDLLYARVIVKNQGAFDIEGVNFQLQIDENEITEFAYDDVIPSGDSKYYVLSQLETDELWHTAHIEAQITDQEDAVLENNMATNEYTGFGNKITLVVYTDDNANETSWTLRDINYEILEQQTGYDTNTTYKHSFCLDANCYFFTIYDKGGDGINNANGFRLVNTNTGIILGQGAQFGDSTMISFCVGNELSSEFTLINDTSCTNTEVFFINQSTGSDYYSWFFEGGNPIASNEANPAIQYHTPGSYDVKLTSWQGENNVTTIKEDFIIVVNCAGVENVETTLFKLYPNPSLGNFSIEIEAQHNFSEMLIYNQIGTLVYKEKLSNNSTHNYQLDLASGLYFIELVSPERNQRRMLLITK